MEMLVGFWDQLVSEFVESSMPIQVFVVAALLLIVYLILSMVWDMIRPRPPIRDMTPVPKEKIVLKEFTIEELRYYNGENDSDGKPKPVYLSLSGVVYDVSRGRGFYGPGGGYASFAGRECSVALAKHGFEPKFFENPDVTTLTPDEVGTLNEWKAFFENKYDHIGNIVKNKRTSQQEVREKEE
mmetsp:Transcript_21985/g.24568  ORF Transcript_21985/g.24568 Transcript_21985/m.24568 type:complete len:184 (-) Transcript_21985:1556-2107(-)